MTIFSYSTFAPFFSIARARSAPLRSPPFRATRLNPPGRSSYSLVVTTHKKTPPPASLMGESVMVRIKIKYRSFLRALNLRPNRPFKSEGFAVRKKSSRAHPLRACAGKARCASTPYFRNSYGAGVFRRRDRLQKTKTMVTPAARTAPASTDIPFPENPGRPPPGAPKSIRPFRTVTLSFGSNAARIVFRCSRAVTIISSPRSALWRCNSASNPPFRSVKTVIPSSKRGSTTMTLVSATGRPRSS